MSRKLKQLLAVNQANIPLQHNLNNMDKRSWCYSFKSIRWNTDNVFAEIQTYKDGLPILCLLSKTMSFMQAMENFLNGTRSSPHFCENPWLYANRTNIHAVFVRHVWSACVDMTWHEGHASKRGWQITCAFSVDLTFLRPELETNSLPMEEIISNTLLQFIILLILAVDWPFLNLRAFSQNQVNKNKKCLPPTCLFISFLMSS